MRCPVRINTGFPSAAKAAKTLGVPKKIAKDLSLLAERSLKTGEFVLPGVGRLVRVHGKWRVERNPASGAASKSAAKRRGKFRVLNAENDTVSRPKKKKK
jgi:DNA-binding protein HU-beta